LRLTLSGQPKLSLHNMHSIVGKVLGNYRTPIGKANFADSRLLQDSCVCTEHMAVQIIESL
jgi:hypothetical protein